MQVELYCPQCRVHFAATPETPAARAFDRLPEKVLTVAGIYGPNASGKSNVLDALSWLSTAVARSLRTWDIVIPRDPFTFRDGPRRPSRFEIEMMVGGVRYAYSVALDEEQVHYEGLFSYPERRRRVLFERDGTGIAFRRGLGGVAGTRELLTPSTLALSAAMRFNEPEVQSFGRELASITTHGLHHLRGPQLLDATEQLFATSPSQAPSALALLRYADLGIGDVQVVDDELAGRRIHFVHRVAGQEATFKMLDESAGTQTWFRLIGPVLHALRDGRTLLFDEIDASLHPRLSAKLIELFQDPGTNPRAAQLIFTTHDTSLLNHLNRDEVWLTEKNPDGATTLTALAEYGGDKVRRSLNLERAYLQGRFGAVPEMDQTLITRALGLDTTDN